MKTAVIGIGLIGGSMVLDLRAKGIATHIIGVDNNIAHGTRAIELGLVDEVLPLEEALREAEIVITTVPVNAIKGVINSVLNLIKDNVVVIDTGSTKASICKAIENHPRRFSFVAAHPIAGTENSGPDAAFEGLFAGKTNIICEAERSSEKALGMAKEIFDALGMKTIYMEPAEHDKHVAYVSHLSHVSSFLLGQTVLDIEADEKNIFNLAGSGFASTVRLAKSSPEMWAPIFEQNAEYLSQALLEYIMHLQKFQYYLMKRDVNELHRIMTEANRIRKVLEGIEVKQAPTHLSKSNSK